MEVASIPIFITFRLMVVTYVRVKVNQPTHSIRQSVPDAFNDLEFNLELLNFHGPVIDLEFRVFFTKPLHKGRLSLLRVISASSK